MTIKDDIKVDIEVMRGRLRAMRAAVLARIDADSLAERDSPDATEGPRDTHDPGDNAVYEVAEDERLYDAERATHDLRLIDDALARIESGTYGSCVDCNEEIEPRRIHSLPTAERCIDCQEQYDKDHMSGVHHATL